MDTQSEPVFGKRSFDDGSSESVSSTTFAPDGTVASSVVSSRTGGADGKARSTKSLAACRSRVTVVCGECKRLKLKCDRRNPCGSCLKRDTVPRCTYSAAAVEKVDVQSLNNRLLVLEATVEAANTASKKPQAKAIAAADGTGTIKSRAYLAAAPNGASVAVNLEGSTGIWLNHLGLGPPTSSATGAGDAGGLSSVEILPASGVREEGVIDFLNDFTSKFRIAAKSSEDSPEHDDDESLGYIGVSPELVLSAIPSTDIRNQIYPFYEAAHVMAPCVNYFVFKQRIEDMYRWAESKDVDSDEPDPMRPTVNFFAAAALAMAIGMECMLLSRDSNPSTAGPSPTEGPASISSSTANDRSMGQPHVPESAYPSDSPAVRSFDPSEPSKLFRLSKLALALSMERIGYDAYDLDYLHAKTLQARYLLVSHHGLENGSNLRLGMSFKGRKKVQKRGKGRARSDKNAKQADAVMTDVTPSSSIRGTGGRSHSLALAPELAGIVAELANSARLMGLNHDPDSPGGEKFSLFVKEMRRRMWWEIVSLDAYYSDCIGEEPLLGNSALTNFPTDVNEEEFTQDSTEFVPPNIESMHGNIEYFIQRSRLVHLAKRWKRKIGNFVEDSGTEDSREARDLIETMKDEFSQWLKELPEHLQAKEIPSLGTTLRLNKGMSPPKRTSVPPGDRGTPAQYDSYITIAMRCELAMSARYALIKFCLPFTKEMREEEAVITDDIDIPPSCSFSALYMVSPAMFMVRAWHYLHSTVKYVWPPLFTCYSMTRQLFDTAVILADVAIQQPLYNPSALASVRIAADILRDPIVSTGRPASGDHGGRPNEAVRILEELIVKAESVSGGTPNTTKRKHEEIDGGPSDFIYDLRFPFVGPDVISVGPSIAPITPASSAGGSTLVDTPSGIAASSSRTQEGPSKSQPRQSAAERGAKTSDQRPTQARNKASHATAVSVRSRVGPKGKDAASRVRANSTTGIRSDGHAGMGPPPAPSAPPPPLHPPLPHSHVQHQQNSPTELSAGASRIHAPFSQPLSPTKTGAHHSPLGFIGPSTGGSPDEYASPADSHPGFQSDGGRFSCPPPAAFQDSSPFTRAPLQIPPQNRSPFDAFGPQGPSSAPTPTHESTPFGPAGMDYSMNVQPHNEFGVMSRHTPLNSEQHRFARDPSEPHPDSGLEGPPPFHHGHGHEQQPPPHGEPMASLNSPATHGWGGQSSVYPAGGWSQAPYYQ